ncbi:MAG: 50S ribosomal protein L10 [Thermoproteota archaeon]|nr:MAG: 50S ribosomal protein L10 [Candidatus Korarchaeota archaeon]RLG55551.1 MAG: 50S ribosomal protein L10 [Candidatus Korarchaeota archaeon]
MPQSSEPRRYPERKVKTIQKILELSKSHSYISAAECAGVPASLLKRVRRELRANHALLVSKKTLARLALRKSERKGVEKLIEHFPQTLLLIFSNTPPYKTAEILDKFEEEMYPRPNEAASEDIVIKKGPTALPPGPVLTTLRSYGIKAKVEKGRITILEDAVILKKGERFSRGVIDLLRNLEMKTKRVKVKMSGAIDKDGAFYPPEVLYTPTQQIVDSLNKAYESVAKLAAHLELPVYPIIPLLVATAKSRAVQLSLATGWYTRETLPLLLSALAAKAKALADAIRF